MQAETGSEKNPDACPKILVDARMVRGRPHGIYQYVARMIRGFRILQEKKKLRYELVFLVSPGFPTEVFAGYKTILAKQEFLSLGEIVEIPKILKEGQFKLYHSPSFSSLLFCPCPWVVTVHDLNHLQFGGIVEKIYYWTLLKRFAKKAAALVTVSEFSRDELAQWLKIDSGKIEIVPNAIERVQIPTEKQVAEAILPFGLEKKKYFFCYANSKPHKNVMKLVEAYRYFRSHGGKGWEIALVGQTMEEVRKLPHLAEPSNPGAEGIVEVVGDVSPEDTLAILAGSSALVSPSIYEGFGLPPVEAAAMGIPVIASDIPPHREGLSDLQNQEVKWVKPKDRDAWVNALLTAAQDKNVAPTPEVREKILNHYSVEKLGENMDRVYRGVLNIQS